MHVCVYGPFRPFLPYEKCGNAPYTQTHMYTHRLFSFFKAFPHPEPQIATKARVLGISTPPKRPLGARGQKLPREQSKMLSWDAFWRAFFFGKSALVHKPRTHKNANPIHTYTQTHPSLCLRAHTHIHAYTQTHPSLCLRSHKHIHAYTQTHQQFARRIYTRISLTRISWIHM